MKALPSHEVRVLASPWPGVYCTDITSDRHYGRHWHADFGLGLLASGAQTSLSGRGRVDAYAGDLIATNPGEVHDGQPLAGSPRRWRMVYLAPDVIAAANADPQAARKLEITRPVIQDGQLSAMLLQLLSKIEAWNALPGSASAEVLACEESLVMTCSILLGRHSTGAEFRPASADLTQIRDRLADDILDPPTLTDMALMAGLSKYQLLRRFHSVYGVTPHAWLLLQRAERARGLIFQGTDLVMAAALCGFADQSHMTRIFSRHFGFTPGAWRKAVASSSHR